MRIELAVIMATVCTLAGLVAAQTPADSLKGTWGAQSAYCGESTVIVTAVESTGIVHGTFICKRTGWKPVMGDKIARNAVKGTLTGTRFVMENADGGGFDLTLEGETLKGFGRAFATSASNPVTYVKQ